MPRLAKSVFPNIPQPITQRGNRRENVFFFDEDRQFYLKLLYHYCKKYKLAVLVYCLMDNHVHLVLTQLNLALELDINEYCLLPMGL
jgi:putative transposase